MQHTFSTTNPGTQILGQTLDTGVIIRTVYGVLLDFRSFGFYDIFMILWRNFSYIYYTENSNFGEEIRGKFKDELKNK